jgi:hypothetical protein
MAIILESVWGHTERPWGYEVRVDYVDSDTGRIVNEVLTWDSQVAPAQSVIDAAVEERRLKVVVMIQPEYKITNQDGTVTMI